MARRSNGKIDFDIAASRAIHPHFYEAPTPPLELLNGMKPMPFQHAGVEYIIARNHGLIGDPPGLTKTAQAIMVSNAIGAKHTLVICPASLRLNWAREIWRWSTIENVETYPVLKSSDGVSLKAHYVIISYDLLRNPAIFAALMAGRWDHLICDEAHALKDPQGNRRTQRICAEDALPSVCGRITLLSGTIMPNQPKECYNAIRLLNWDAINGASLEDFTENYYARGGGWVRKKVKIKAKNGQEAFAYRLVYDTDVRNVPTNLADLQYRLRKHIMVRREKSEVMPWLPKLRWHPFPLAITADIRRAMKHPGYQAAERLYDLDPESFDQNIPVDGAVSTARLELGMAKAPGVADYIEDLMASGVTKLVVAAWHREALAYYRDRLKKYGLVYMDGRTSSIAKQTAVDDFQDKEGVGIILGQTIPLGLGWTLTKAQDVVDAEPDWVPGNNQQLGDRVARPGQIGDACTLHIPVVPGTLDEKIIGTNIRKARNIDAAMDRRDAA